MAEETVLTQGTELFVIDTLSSSVAEIVKLNCPTGIPGFGAGVPAQIPTTCLDNLIGETSRPGLNTTSQVAIPFNFKPVRRSHRLLYDLAEAKDVFKWIVCLSDGSNAPSLDSNDDFVAPAGRTSYTFDASVDSVILDIATNEIVRGTLTITIQAEGIVPYWNGDPLVD